MKKVHVIGCGQVGMSFSKLLLSKSYNVCVYEHPQTGFFQQHPWGWMRRVTLQQKDRLKLPLERMNIDSKYMVRGPMIISTDSDNRKRIWDSWKNQTNTDSYFLSNEESVSKFKLTTKHNLVCDSRDFLFDFDSFHKDSVVTLKQRVEWNDRSAVSKLIWSKNRLQYLELSDETLVPIAKDDKVLLSVGNQTRRFFDLPFMGVSLAYTIIEPTMEKKEYISMWSDSYSVQHFPTFTKIGCGMKGTIDFLPPIKYMVDFFPIFQRSNYNWMETNTEQLKKACEQVGVPFSKEYKCTVDITPNFLPLVVPMGTNLVVVCGMSGSGFTTYEPWFLELIYKRMIYGSTGLDHRFQFTNYSHVESYMY